MASHLQIRRALNSVGNAAEFLRRYPQVAERTFYRQRGEHPPKMRASVAAKIEQALIDEGLLRPQREPAA